MARTSTFTSPLMLKAGGNYGKCHYTHLKCYADLDAVSVAKQTYSSRKNYNKFITTLLNTILIIKKHEFCTARVRICEET
jgi:hypothetical protein